MRSKIQLGLRPAVPDANMPEVALLRLLNFREPKLDESSFINQSQENIASKSARGDQPGDNQESTASLENFNLEDLPTKMILVDQKSAEDTHLISYHAGKINLFSFHYRGPIPGEKTYNRRCQTPLQGVGEA